MNARTQTGLRPPDMLLPQSAKNLSLLSNAAPHWLQNLAGEQTPDSYSLPLSDHVLAIYARSSPASYQFCFPVKGSNFGIGWPVIGSNLPLGWCICTIGWPVLGSKRGTACGTVGDTATPYFTNVAVNGLSTREGSNTGLATRQ